jgi:hypothetical protein
MQELGGVTGGTVEAAKLEGRSDAKVRAALGKPAMFAWVALGSPDRKWAGLVGPAD